MTRKILRMPIENQLILRAAGRGDKPMDATDIEVTRSIMIQGNYSASITDCEVVGISGGCGPQCPVLLDAKCPIICEAIDNGTLTRAEAEEYGYSLEQLGLANGPR